jgi:hypothetical protein
MKKRLMIIISLLSIFVIAHATPSMALRTEVILMGHPVASLTTRIIEDDFHNQVDKEKFAELNAKAYTLTKPPVETATQGKLRNYLVRKVGFLYFAEYYGEG